MSKEKKLARTRKAIRDDREAKGWSRMQLANEATRLCPERPLSEGQVNNAENSGHLGPFTYQRIADALGWSEARRKELFPERSVR